jgi:hypothetical protein
MLSDVLKEQYNGKVLKLSLSSGCTCPTRDGTKGRDGCSFCSEGGSGEFAAHFAPVKEQIHEAKKLVDGKFPKEMSPADYRYIAYFQSFSNTYGCRASLEALYREVLELPEIVLLSIGTRPDCLGDDMMEMLAGLNRIKPVWIELGLQTIHEGTAKAFGRGYTLDVFEDAYRKLKAAGLQVIVHLIFGLPGETEGMMLDSVRYLAGLDPVIDGIKLQQLYILKGTRLAAEYQAVPFPIMSMERYTDLVVKSLAFLPEETVVHRLTGDPPKKLLIAPAWCADKKRVLGTLQMKIKRA